MGCQIWQEHLCYLHSILQDIPFLQRQVSFFFWKESYNLLKIKVTFNSSVTEKFYDLTSNVTS